MNVLLQAIQGIPVPVLLAAALAAVFIIAVAGFARSYFGGTPDEVLSRLTPYVTEDTSGAQARLLMDREGIVLRKRDELEQRTLTAVERQLIHAGFRRGGAFQTFVGAKLVAGAALPVVYFIISVKMSTELHMSALYGIILAAVGYFAPNIWLSGRVATRKKLLEQALPDALDLLVTCVEAGLGLDSALSRVADEIALSAPLLSTELRATFFEIGAGLPRPEALKRLAERTGVEDLRSLAATLIQAEAFGTSVATALRTRSEWMRTRRMQRAEERAAIVSVKMTVPLVLCILPSLIAVIMGPAAVRIIINFLPNFGNPG